MKEPVKIKRLLPRKHVAVLFRYCFGNVTIAIERRNKAGRLIYPYLYQLPARNIAQYEMVARQGGALAYSVPLGDFKKIAKRKELGNVLP